MVRNAVIHLEALADNRAVDLAQQNLRLLRHCVGLGGFGLLGSVGGRGVLRYIFSGLLRRRLLRGLLRKRSCALAGGRLFVLDLQIYIYLGLLGVCGDGLGSSTGTGCEESKPLNRVGSTRRRREGFLTVGDA